MLSFRCRSLNAANCIIQLRGHRRFRCRFRVGGRAPVVSGYIHSMRIPALLLASLLLASAAAAQAVDPGRQAFEVRCARCHGADGNGGEMGPTIVLRLSAHNDEQLTSLIRQGLPARGMPPMPVADPEMGALLKFLRTIQRAPGAGQPTVQSFQTTDGRTVQGQVTGQGVDDLQLRSSDGRVHLYRRTGERWREVTSETSWPTYNGDPGGNRYTTLTQINKATVGRLAPSWIFTVPTSNRLQLTPVVVDGIMYVTAPNECYALDAGSGRQIWRFQRPRTPGLLADAGTQSRRERGRRPALHAHRPRAHHRAQPLYWRAAVGRRARGLPQELLRDVSAARGGHRGDFRRLRRRARSERVRRRARSGNRQGAVAVLDRAEARRRRAPRPGRARTSIMAARRRGSPAATIRSSISSTGRSATPARSTTATTARATTSTPARSSRSTAGLAR